MTDLVGREVKVKIAAQRVVAVGPGSLRLAAYAQGTGRVVGIRRVTIMHPYSRNYINNLHISLGGAVRNCLLPEEEEMKGVFSGAGFKDILLEDVPNRYRLIGRKG